MKLLEVHVHGIEVFLFLKTIQIIKEIKRYNTSYVPNSYDGIFCDGTGCMWHVYNVTKKSMTYQSYHPSSESFVVMLLG